jgi:hypothetical protein
LKSEAVSFAGDVDSFALQMKPGRTLVFDG